MLKEQHIQLDTAPEVFDWLAKNGYSPVYGARPLKRLLQSEMLNKLALMLLDGRIREKEVVRVKIEDSELVVVPNHAVVREVDPALLE
jgi:ATP-dependent Clp protease ATP-binding subunit ClpB